MNFLLDTNILSELIRPQPHPAVVHWLQAQPETAYYFSVVTLSELAFGVARLPEGQRKAQMQDWLSHDLQQRFIGRILPVSDTIGLCCGEFRAIRQSCGRPLALADGLIAATAASHAMTLVTRNIKDFEELGLDLINPWQI